MFSELGEGAEIRNVTFTEVTYILEVDETSGLLKGVQVATLAKSANGAKVTKVTVSGKIITNYSGELPKLNSAVYEADSTIEESEFKAVITIEKKQ